ncbi:MAG TPA: zf-HC2 domain-containing protein, partial [Candidatus Sulfomarinibacteraceae bacterium]|nr:zf-HC2 domain-containing protein [Candidatus Sulfomarinibacteraceae bacterium]
MTARGMDLHGPYRLLAAAAVDGRLDAEEAIALEGHLAGCSDCRSVQAGLWRDHRWLAEPGPAADPPPGIRAAVVEAARRPPARHADRTTRALLLAACLVVAVAGIATFGLRQRPATGSIPPTSGPQATASPTVVPTIAAPGAIGEGTLVGKEGTTASITFSVEVRGLHEDVTGRVDFADPDGTRWTGTVNW